jgi:hypothetical protein
MTEMFVDGGVAAAPFTATGEAVPAMAPRGGVPGADPLTVTCTTALDSAIALLSNADGIAETHEAIAGSTGTSNIQNLTQTEQNNATKLRDPLGQGAANGTGV